MNLPKLQAINFWLIGWWVMLILNVIVGVADILQGGTAWPINLIAIIGMIVLKAM